MNKFFPFFIIPILILSANLTEAVTLNRQANTNVNVRKVFSPNKKYYALITTYHFKSKNNSESKIEIFSYEHKPLTFRSFISKDSDHGMEISKAQWTNDSKFFVFNGVIQGGHQPGHLPTYFFSIKNGKIQPLDPVLGIWVTGNFNILSNDRLSVQVRDRLPNGGFNDTVIKRIDMKDLKRK